MEYFIPVVLFLLHMWVSWSAVLQMESAGACVCVLHWQQYCKLAAFARLKVFTVTLLNIQAFFDVMLCCGQVVTCMSKVCLPSTAGYHSCKNILKYVSKLHFSNCSWCFVCAALHSSCNTSSSTAWTLFLPFAISDTASTAVSTVTRLCCSWQGMVQLQDRLEMFLFSSTTRPPLALTAPSVQCIMVALHPTVKVTRVCS